MMCSDGCSRGMSDVWVYRPYLLVPVSILILKRLSITGSSVVQISARDLVKDILSMSVVSHHLYKNDYMIFKMHLSDLSDTRS